MHRSSALSSDFMAVLAEIESRFPVLHWQFDGIPIWPLLRVRWMFAEWAAVSARAAGEQSARVWNVLPRVGSMTLGILRALIDAAGGTRAQQRADARRDLVFLSDGLSFARLGSRWVERFCDPLIAQAAERGLSSALWVPLHVYRKAHRRAAEFVQGGIDRATLGTALRLRRLSPSICVPMHDQVLATLSRHGFGAASLAIEKIMSDGRRLRAVADFYKAKVEITRPKLAFLVGFYSLEGFAFVLACREAGVPVVDIQHGVQGALHPAYAAWPRATGGTHQLLPDRFWVWSSWEHDVISHWTAGSSHAAVIGGNPWLQVWREGSDWPGVGEALAAARALKARAAGRPVILVALQFGLPAAAQIEPLARLLEHAADQFAFWVRLHPVMLSQREAVRRQLGGSSRFFLDESTDLPLHALLPSVDLHLTHSSSTVIEAAQFGIRSILTTDWGAELFELLRERGWAHVEKGDAAQLTASIHRVLSLARDARLDDSPCGSALDTLLDAVGFDAQAGT